VPAFVGSALDPLVGAFGDTPRRRALIIGGGLAFALSSALAAGAVGLGTLLVALATHREMRDATAVPRTE